MSVFAFASCDSLSDNDPNEVILAGYYKPLVGKWNATKCYGTEVDEFGMEKPFDFSSGYENNLYYDTFEFGDNNLMTHVSHFNSDGDHYEYKYEVVFRIDVPNFFTANSLESSLYLNYEIVKITGTTLHLIDRES